MFTITKQHLALLHAACLEWNDCEFGAPGIDPKRPYGSSSVYHDIAAILHIKPEGEEGSFTGEQKDRMRRLHGELWEVIEIARDLAVAGNYEREQGRERKWKRITGQVWTGGEEFIPFATNATSNLGGNE